MIVVFNEKVSEEALNSFVNWIHSQKLDCVKMAGDKNVVLQIVGDTTSLDVQSIKNLNFVDSVIRLTEPYKKVSKNYKDETIIKVASTVIGGNNFQVIAGPCSVEGEKQITEIAKAVKEAGATLLRGGAFKPRTSPYTFQGLKEEGIKYLIKAKEETGLPVVSEIISKEYIDEYSDIDILQVGARNMQNFDLLKALGKIDKPILLKRGMGSTIEEWLMSAEYIMNEGNENVILCERGIRTFEQSTRNALDFSSIALIKQKTHLPVIVDPSHASGMSSLIKPLSLASCVVGANGLLLEVHNDPAKALSDGAQSITPSQLKDIIESVNKLIAIK